MTPYRDQFPQCPRCGIAMVALTLITGHEIASCDQCNGNWIAHAVFTEIATRFRARRDLTLTPREHAESAVPCPDCSRTLVPRLHDDRVAVDECPRHGVWFDWAELQKCLS